MKSHRPSRFHRWVIGWAELITGICLICTLGHWHPTVALRAISWALRSIPRPMIQPSKKKP